MTTSNNGGINRQLAELPLLLGLLPDLADFVEATRISAQTFTALAESAEEGPAGLLLRGQIYEALARVADEVLRLRSGKVA